MGVMPQTDCRYEDSFAVVSLTPECAREVRARRKIAAIAIIPKRVSTAAYYESMLGLESTLGACSKITEVYYQRGVQRAKQHREHLRGRPWCETEITKSGRYWTWVTYRDGYALASGSARSQVQAETDALESILWT